MSNAGKDGKSGQHKILLLATTLTASLEDID